MVVVGAGFGGLYAVRALRNTAVDITLIDRRNHHLFQPLLYQVATAALNPSDVAAPIRRVLRRQRNATALLAEVTGFDLERRIVTLDDGGAITFDYLVVATGATHSYFGRDDWASFAPGLKTIEDALRIRRTMLLAYERAERESDPGIRLRHLTFVIVGGGPTGVELAGAMAEIARHTLARDFRRIDPSDARFLLLEGSNRILPAFHPKLSEAAVRQLERLGVTVTTGAMVTEVGPEYVKVGEDVIEASTIVWAAGVAASPLGRQLGDIDKAGRVLVGPDLTVPGHPEVFVIGDLAHVEQVGAPLPGVAPVAIQQGRFVAGAISRSLSGGKPSSFHYRDRGSLATIGRAAAVAEVRGLRLSGLIAWALWVLVHIFYLIGFRNRYIVLAEWAWEYLTWDKGARLITGDDRNDRTS